MLLAVSVSKNGRMNVQDLILLFCVSFAVATVSSSVAGSVASEIIEQQQEAPQNGLVWPLHARHGLVRERGLLRNGTLPISGAVREVG